MVISCLTWNLDTPCHCLNWFCLSCFLLTVFYRWICPANSLHAGVTLNSDPVEKRPRSHFSTDVWSTYVYSEKTIMLSVYNMCLNKFQCWNWPIPSINDPPKRESLTLVKKGPYLEIISGESNFSIEKLPQIYKMFLK